MYQYTHFFQILKKSQTTGLNLLVNVINMEINSHNGLLRIQAHSLTGLLQELQIHLFLVFLAE